MSTLCLFPTDTSPIYVTCVIAFILLHYGFISAPFANLWTPPNSSECWQTKWLNALNENTLNYIECERESSGFETILNALQYESIIWWISTAKYVIYFFLLKEEGAANQKQFDCIRVCGHRICIERIRNFCRIFVVHEKNNKKSLYFVSILFNFSSVECHRRRVKKFSWTPKMTWSHCFTHL